MDELLEKKLEESEHEYREGSTGVLEIERVCPTAVVLELE